MKTSQTQLSKQDQVIKHLFQELLLFQVGLEDSNQEFDEIISLIDELLDQLISHFDFKN